MGSADTSFLAVAAAMMPTGYNNLNKALQDRSFGFLEGGTVDYNLTCTRPAVLDLWLLSCNTSEAKEYARLTASQLDWDCNALRGLMARDPDNSYCKRDKRVSTRRPACSAGLQCGSSHTRDVFASAGGREKMAPAPQTLAIPVGIARGCGRTHMAEAMRRHLAVFRRSSARGKESSQRGSTEMPAPHQLLEARLVTSYWPSLRPEAFAGVQKISDSSKLRTTSTASSRSERDAAIRLRPWETSVLRDSGSWRRRCVAVLIEQPRLQRFFGVFDIRAPPHRLQQAELSRSFPRFSQRVTPATTSTCRDLQQLLPGGADYFSRRPTTGGTVCFTCISRCSTSGAASISMWPAAVVAVIFGRCRALSDAVFSSRYSAAGGAAYISMRCGPATRWAVFSSRYSTAGGAPYVSMRCGPATRWAVFSSRYPAAGGAPYVSMRCDLAARWAVVSSRCPATTGADYVSRCPTAGGAVDYVSRCRATGDFISHCLTARRADNGSRYAAIGGADSATALQQVWWICQPLLQKTPATFLWEDGR
ncbi:Hypp2025 [Branchiostoma lanceolatum]|uniref:Hypp2025 protein n=1 Tax=Branchiostoma lanceolatum TaxID=7740 RepID=A0A8J9ZR08_BRALA|nr:Hypp2025 [Branchiostoma lanceolatum]